MGEAATLIPEAGMVGGEAAGIGLVGGAEGAASGGEGLFSGLFGGGDGLFGSGITWGQAAGAASLGSLALSGLGSVMGGQGTADQRQREAQNYLYAGAAKAANYAYAGETEAEQREMEAAGYTAQASRARRAAEFGRTQAELTDVAMRENTSRVIGGIATMRSAMHTDPNSPTGIAVAEHQQTLGDRQRQAQLISINSQVAEDEATASFLDSASTFSLSQAARARTFAAYNADIARRSAGMSADAASASGNAAETAGYIGGIAKILAGIGKTA